MVELPRDVLNEIVTAMTHGFDAPEFTVVTEYSASAGCLAFVTGEPQRLMMHLGTAMCDDYDTELIDAWLNERVEIGPATNRRWTVFWPGVRVVQE